LNIEKYGQIHSAKKEEAADEKRDAKKDKGE